VDDRLVRITDGAAMKKRRRDTLPAPLSATIDRTNQAVGGT
jgi:hypothetical protein